MKLNTKLDNFLDSFNLSPEILNDAVFLSFMDADVKGNGDRT